MTKDKAADGFHTHVLTQRHQELAWCCKLELKVDRKSTCRWQVGGRSDVKKANPWGTDMEVVVKELGLYDHISTETETSLDSTKNGHVSAV